MSLVDPHELRAARAAFTRYEVFSKSCIGSCRSDRDVLLAWKRDSFAEIPREYADGLTDTLDPGPTAHPLRRAGFADQLLRTIGADR